MITTNRERDLPQAFLRRCVSLVFDEPGEIDLLAIARAHYPKADLARVKAIIGKMLDFRQQPRGGGRAPGTSEFLDAIRACKELKISVDGEGADGELWRQIEKAVLLKPTV